MKNPSNTTYEEWSKDKPQYDCNCDEAFWYLINHQIDNRHDMDREWAMNPPKERIVTGENLADIIRKEFGWKTGDMKNGIKGISVNNKAKDLEYSDLFRKLTSDADGMSLTIKNSTVIINTGKGE